MKFKKLSFVIPVYNEQNTLKTLVAKVLSHDYGIDKVELVLVNDGSTDDSPKILKELEADSRIRVFHNSRNLGKSQTVKNGLLNTTGDLVVIQDADLEYEPRDLIEFVVLFQSSTVDVVYGNRFGKKNKVIYPQNWIGNTFLSFVSAVFTGLRSGMWARDMEVCYKMARGDIFRNIAKTIVSKTNFGLEPEMTAKFSKYKINGRHLNWKQLPIQYNPRSIAEGKHMKAVKDGMLALGEILRFNLLS